MSPANFRHIRRLRWLSSIHATQFIRYNASVQCALSFQRVHQVLLVVSNLIICEEMPAVVLAYTKLLLLSTIERGAQRVRELRVIWVGWVLLHYRMLLFRGWRIVQILLAWHRMPIIVDTTKPHIRLLMLDIGLILNVLVAVRGI